MWGLDETSAYFQVDKTLPFPLVGIAVKIGETYFLLTTEGMDMTARSK